jgi:hypothetical protein
VFDSLREGIPYYLGPLEDTPGNAILVSGLDEIRPRAAVLVPIPQQDHVPAVLYGDNLEAPLDSVDLRALRGAAAKAGLALELLLLKHRIQQ